MVFKINSGFALLGIFLCGNIFSYIFENINDNLLCSKFFLFVYYVSFKLYFFSTFLFLILFSC